MSLQENFESNRCCVIMPTYNNGQSLAQVLNSILNYTDHIIIIDDGSTDATPEILSNYPNLEIIQFNKNKGKGYALRKAFTRAGEMGYSHAISMDSDGQHFADDLPVFMDALEKNPDTLFVGAQIGRAHV